MNSETIIKKVNVSYSIKKVGIPQGFVVRTVEKGGKLVVVIGDKEGNQGR